LIMIAGLAACSGPTLSSQSYPGRTNVEVMSADGVTLRSYACQSTSNAAAAHRYVDGAILEAQNRFARESGGGFAAGLGVRAEVNAEIARISRNVEAEYGCALLGSRDSRQINPFG
jgi:hypothetical protein